MTIAAAGCFDTCQAAANGEVGDLWRPCPGR